MEEKKSKRRLSSILKKSPHRKSLGSIDQNEEPVIVEECSRRSLKRRVSFANTHQIKEVLSVGDIVAKWPEPHPCNINTSNLNMENLVIAKKNKIEVGKDSLITLMSAPIVQKDALNSSDMAVFDSTGTSLINVSDSSSILNTPNVSSISTCSLADSDKNSGLSDSNKENQVLISQPSKFFIDDLPVVVPSFLKKHNDVAYSDEINTTNDSSVFQSRMDDALAMLQNKSVNGSAGDDIISQTSSPVTNNSSTDGSKSLSTATGIREDHEENMEETACVKQLIRSSGLAESQADAARNASQIKMSMNESTDQFNSDDAIEMTNCLPAGSSNQLNIFYNETKAHSEQSTFPVNNSVQERANQFDADSPHVETTSPDMSNESKLEMIRNKASLFSLDDVPVVVPSFIQRQMDSSRDDIETSPAMGNITCSVKEIDANEESSSVVAMETVLPSAVFSPTRSQPSTLLQAGAGQDDESMEETICIRSYRQRKVTTDSTIDITAARVENDDVEMTSCLPAVGSNMLVLSDRKATEGITTDRSVSSKLTGKSTDEIPSLANDGNARTAAAFENCATNEFIQPEITNNTVEFTQCLLLKPNITADNAGKISSSAADQFDDDCMESTQCLKVSSNQSNQMDENRSSSYSEENSRNEVYPRSLQSTLLCSSKSTVQSRTESLAAKKGVDTTDGIAYGLLPKSDAASISSSDSLTTGVSEDMKITQSLPTASAQLECPMISDDDPFPTSTHTATDNVPLRHCSLNADSSSSAKQSEANLSQSKVRMSEGIGNAFPMYKENLLTAVVRSKPSEQRLTSVSTSAVKNRPNISFISDIQSAFNKEKFANNAKTTYLSPPKTLCQEFANNDDVTPRDTTVDPKMSPSEYLVGRADSDPLVGDDVRLTSCIPVESPETYRYCVADEPSTTSGNSASAACSSMMEMTNCVRSGIEHETRIELATMELSAAIGNSTCGSFNADLVKQIDIFSPSSSDELHSGNALDGRYSPSQKEPYLINSVAGARGSDEAATQHTSTSAQLTTSSGFNHTTSRHRSSESADRVKSSSSIKAAKFSSPPRSKSHSADIDLTGVSSLIPDANELVPSPKNEDSRVNSEDLAPANDAKRSSDSARLNFDSTSGTLVKESSSAVSSNGENVKSSKVDSSSEQFFPSAKKRLRMTSESNQSAMTNDICDVDTAENISICKFLDLYVDVPIKTKNKASRRSAACPIAATAMPSSLQDLVKTVFDLEYQMPIYTSFQQSIREKLRRAEKKIASLESDIEASNPEIMKRIRFESSEERSELVDRVNTLARQCKGNAKAQWKKAKTKLRKSLQMSWEAMVFNEVSSLFEEAREYGDVEQLVDDATAKMDSARQAAVDKLAKLQNHEHLATEQQINAYRRNCQKIKDLEEALEKRVKESEKLEKDRKHFNDAMRRLWALYDERKRKEKEKGKLAREKALSAKEKRTLKSYVLWEVVDYEASLKSFSFLEDTLLFIAQRSSAGEWSFEMKSNFAGSQQVNVDLYKFLHRVLLGDDQVKDLLKQPIPDSSFDRARESKILSDISRKVSAAITFRREATCLAHDVRHCALLFRELSIDANFYSREPNMCSFYVRFDFVNTETGRISFQPQSYQCFDGSSAFGRFSLLMLHLPNYRLLAYSTSSKLVSPNGQLRHSDADILRALDDANRNQPSFYCLCNALLKMMTQPLT